MHSELSPTKFQAAALSFRSHANLLLAGGRGGGKSHALILACLAHCREFGTIARPLVVRESWQSLQELQEKIYSLCIVAFGPRTSRNKAEGTITLPIGAIISFTNISDDEAYRRAQGRTFTALYGDEVGAFPPQAWSYFNRLRSNLRVPVGKRAEIVLTANPHGKSHHVLYKRHIAKAQAWKPYRDDAGELWINCPSTLADNPHIDQAAYKRSLVASTSGDTALAQAWIDGTWGTLGGNLFANFDAGRHIIAPPPRFLLDARFVVGSDWGTSAPATAILMAELRRGFHYEGRRFVHGDVIALEEVSTLISRDDLSKGDGRSPITFAEDIEALLRKWQATSATVIVDSARGLEGDTVLGYYQAAGLDASLPDKRSRVEKWDLLRQRLQNAIDGERNAAYFTTLCPALVETIPEAPRSPLRAEEMDPNYQADHFIDGFVYGLYHCEHVGPSGSGRYLGGY